MPPIRSDDPAFPAREAARAASLSQLDDAIATCRACPRLVAWREQVAAVKRAAFRDCEYWAKPVPGFGPADAALAVVGLAPAAHGANRTGRIFTGDEAGNVLYAALHAIGLSSQPTATHRGDGLALFGVRITAPVRCAPPANKPSPVERDTCRPWLVRELELLRPTLRAVVVLGAFGWHAVLPALAASGWAPPRPQPKFGHGSHTLLVDTTGHRELHIVGCYHPSQRNLFTGRLTPAMLRDQLTYAANLAGLHTRSPLSRTAHTPIPTHFP